MANARTTPFPVKGDHVLADDGSTWTYDGESMWIQGDPWLTDDERAKADALEREATQRLAADHGAFALAFGAVQVAKPESRLNESDGTAQFTLALAISALRDSILEVATGKRTDLERATLMHLRTFLGDPEVASAQNELEKIRRKVADTLAPDTVTAKARGAVDSLGDLAGKLPSTSEARSTITQIVTSTKAQPELTDKLFRQIYFETKDPNLAIEALNAASEVAKAWQ